VLHVQTAQAKTRTLVRTLRVAGTIDDNAMRHRVMAAYVDGRVDKLHVNYIGAEVSEGQPLADFYSPSLLQAEREYRQLGGELKKNTALRLRQMGLTQTQIDLIDQKPADVLTSQILAPISGTVVAQSIYEGQYVATGQQLFEIADFSTMWFMFRAYEQDMPWIKTGQSVTVTTPSLPDKSFAGKIAFIDPNFDEATRSTKVRVELPNPLVNGRRELLHRLYADGMVALEAPAVLTVPRPAVIEAGPQAVVYIDQGGGAYEQAVVKTGRRGDTHIEVLSGVKEGDAVVTNGNLLIDGQAEMNRAFMTAPEATMPVTAQTGLNEEQKKSIAEFITVADAMAAALAKDDLAAFNKASEPAMNVTGAMVKLLGQAVENPDDLDKARHFHGFDDIKAARTAFHKFSVAATAALEPLRKAGQTPDFQIMTNQSILIRATVVEGQGDHTIQGCNDLLSSSVGVGIFFSAIHEFGPYRRACRQVGNTSGSEPIDQAGVSGLENPDPYIRVEEVAHHQVFAGGRGSSSGISNSLSAHMPITSANSGIRRFISSIVGNGFSSATSEIASRTRDSSARALSGSRRFRVRSSSNAIVVTGTPCHGGMAISTPHFPPP
jgi:Cu(I)/Ag(I) efflux system membrane fusion protein